MTFRSSASQIDTYETCPRKWAFDKIDGMPRLDTPATLAGKAIHDELEQWLTHRDTPANPTALALVGHLPPPQSVEVKHVEIEIRPLVEGTPFLGYIDLWFPRTGTIYDHKTCGSFRYAIKAEEMHDNIQAALYAHWAFEQGLTEVRCQWNYGTRSDAPKTRAVRRTMRPADIAERMAKTAQSARECRAYVETPGIVAMDVPAKSSGCAKYGGCPYQRTCNLSMKEMLMPAEETTKDELQARLAERIAARKAKAKGAAPAPEPDEEREAIQAESAPAPEPEPAPPKAERKRRRKADPVPMPPPPAAAHVMATAMAESLELMLSTYARGFREGFEAGRK